MNINFKKTIEDGVFFLVLIVLFCSIINTSQFISDGNLDPSWQNSYNYFHIMSMQFGSNIAFTYGPLAYLYVQAFSPELYWDKIIFSLILALAVCLIMLIVRRKFGLISFLVLSCSFIICRGYDSFIFSFQLLLLAVFLMNRRQEGYRGYVQAALLICVIAATGLIKFTFMLSGTALITVLLLSFILRNHWRLALFGVIWFLISVSVIWMVLGQELFNLPYYLVNSFEIARGYNEAMAIYGPVSTVLFTIVLMAAYVIVIPLQVLKNYKNNIELLFVLLGMCGFIFISWKHGIVRQDGHIAEFYSFMSFIYALLFAMNYKKINENEEIIAWLAKKKFFRDIDHEYLILAASNILKRSISIILVFVSISAFGYTFYSERFVQELVFSRIHSLKENVHFITHPSALAEKKKGMDMQYNEMSKKLELPQIKRIVGNQTVDIYNFNQDYAIYNGLNWNPRPVFQGYSAYTSKLLQLNKNDLIANAPEFVLFQNQTIDHRFPLIDDSLWLYEILHKYKFVTQEKGFLLFQQRHSVDELASYPLEMYKSEQTTFEQTIDIEADNRLVYASIHIQSNALGKLRSLLFKPAQVNLSIQFVDGEEQVFRIIPEMLREPILLSPLNETNDDVMRALVQQNQRIMKSIKISAPAGSKYFNSDIRVSLFRDHSPIQSEVENYLNLQWSDILKRSPERIETEHPLEKVQVAHSPTMLFHPKASMEFKLKPEDTSLHAVVGLRPEAKQKGKSDGVQFYWEGFSDNEWKAIAKFNLEPDKFSDDFVDFSTLLPANTKYTVVRLRVDYGKANDSSWDWALIKEVDIN
ncbi:hypothetical protein [Paenibacillus sp. KS-LC4]|uniref:hypothetical protein n=1 Tax=Paenibacillus sp. KS-LC4 TaxID=2979727 RepID=UPI0030D365DA